MIGEFVGTTLFLFFAFGGTQVANIGDGSTANNTTTGSNTGGVDPSKLLYISLSFGFSLMVNAWIFFRISGGLFNPAVSSLSRISIYSNSKGHACTHPHARPRSHPRYPPPHSPDQWCLFRRLPRQRHIPKSIQRPNNSGCWNNSGTRRLDRSTLHSFVGVHNHHACEREASSYIYRADWDWPCTFHRGTRSSLLYRRLIEPSS